MKPKLTPILKETYQVEAATCGKADWNQLKPTVTTREDGLTLLAAREIEERENRSPGAAPRQFRLTKTTLSIIA